VSYVVSFRRSDTPGLDDAAGGEDPPPEGVSDPLPNGEHELLTQALCHMTRCAKRIERAIGLLDNEPEKGDDDPYNSDSGSGPTIGYDDDADRRARRYAMASNI
jgi:hypothetical protein